MIYWLTICFPLSHLFKEQLDIGVHISVSDAFTIFLACFMIAQYILSSNLVIKYQKVFNIYSFLLFTLILSSIISDIYNQKSFMLPIGLTFLIIKIFVYYNIFKNALFSKKICQGFLYGTLITLCLIVLEELGLILFDPTKSPSGTFQNKNNFALFLGGYIIALSANEYHENKLDKRKFLIFAIALSLRLRAFVLSQLHYVFYKRIYFLFIFFSPLLILPGEFNISQLIVSFGSAVKLDDVSRIRDVEDLSLGIRFWLFMEGINFIQNAPLIGHGSHYFRENMFILDKNLSPHNTYILLWVEGGLVSFLCYLALIVTNLRKGYPITSITILIAIWSLFADLITRDIVALWLALLFVHAFYWAPKKNRRTL